MDIRERLEYFNRKVSHIEEMSFASHVEKAGIVSWDTEKGSDSVYIGPSREQRYAAVLRVRFFMQKNEPCSLQKMRNATLSSGFSRVHQGSGTRHLAHTTTLSYLRLREHMSRD
jgi:hypothetical protein